MGLGMKEQAVPEVVRIFRLIATAPGGFGNHKIRWMVNGNRVGFGPDAFWNDMMTIVGIALSAAWRARSALRGRRPALGPFPSFQLRPDLLQARRGLCRPDVRRALYSNRLSRLRNRD